MSQKNTSLIVVVVLVLAAALFSVQQGFLDPFLDHGNGDGEADGEPEPTPETPITVAAFNIQVFGRTKRGSRRSWRSSWTWRGSST